MNTEGIKPKKSDVITSILAFMFTFKNTKGDLLYHWISGVVPGFNYPSIDFYDELEEELKSHDVPSMEMSRIEFGEGGLLSDKRTYLRMMRERLTIDVCAAPFGNGYFFSCRTVYVPALLRLWHILAALFVFGLVEGLLLKPLGFVFTQLALVALVFAIVATLRNISSSTFHDLDVLLLKIPVLSTFYEQWFRQETYYRQDTRLLYLDVIPKLVKELAEKTVGAKGLTLTRDRERAPIFGDLYRKIPKDKSPDEK